MIPLFWRSGEDSGRVFRAGSPAVHYRRARRLARRRLAAAAVPSAPAAAPTGL